MKLYMKYTEVIYHILLYRMNHMQHKLLDKFFFLIQALFPYHI